MGGKILENQSSNGLKWIVEINTGMINNLIKIVRTVTKGEGDLDSVLKKEQTRPNQGESN